MRVRVVAVLLLVSVLAVALALLRGLPVTAVGSTLIPGVRIECAGSTGVKDDCRAWGDEILAEGPPSTTFEMDDLVRLRLERPMLGFASTCVAEYFVSRYPDDATWDDEVACRR
ncbi:MAG: hypothetical protein M3153_10660 [Chloroflexota bacterium]|nr:hypothetical protein [Chloroflexota bacterium]